MTEVCPQTSRCVQGAFLSSKVNCSHTGTKTRPTPLLLPSPPHPTPPLLEPGYDACLVCARCRWGPRRDSLLLHLSSPVSHSFPSTVQLAEKFSHGLCRVRLPGPCRLSAAHLVGSVLRCALRRAARSRGRFRV